MLRTLLLDFEVPQNPWTKILPGVIFALNSSLSSATKRSPYEVIFGRLPILPIDLVLGTVEEFSSVPTPVEYIKDLRIQLRDIITEVSKNLNISREKMIKQYNKHIIFHEFSNWVRVRN